MKQSLSELRGPEYFAAQQRAAQRDEEWERRQKAERLVHERELGERDYRNRARRRLRG